MVCTWVQFSFLLVTGEVMVTLLNNSCYMLCTHGGVKAQAMSLFLIVLVLSRVGVSNQSNLDVVRSNQTNK